MESIWKPLVILQWDYVHIVQVNVKCFHYTEPLYFRYKFVSAWITPVAKILISDATTSEIPFTHPNVIFLTTTSALMRCMCACAINYDMVCTLAIKEYDAFCSNHSFTDPQFASRNWLHFVSWDIECYHVDSFAFDSTPLNSFSDSNI